MGVLMACGAVWWCFGVVVGFLVGGGVWWCCLLRGVGWFVFALVTVVFRNKLW